MATDGEPTSRRSFKMSQALVHEGAHPLRCLDELSLGNYTNKVPGYDNSPRIATKTSLSKDPRVAEAREGVEGLQVVRRTSNDHTRVRALGFEGIVEKPMRLQPITSK